MISSRAEEAKIVTPRNFLLKFWLEISEFFIAIFATLLPRLSNKKADQQSFSNMGDYRSSVDIITEAPSPSSRKLRSVRVLVTGFGPFGEHSVNASWESVKQLRHFSDLTSSVELIIEEIPVVYSEVQTIVPELWKKYQPDLVIHCGVSGLLAHRNMIQIERQAHNYGYFRPDVQSDLPPGGCYKLGDAKTCLSTGLPVEDLVCPEKWCSAEFTECMLSCQVSSDAGRFLCEFIYFTSLSINADRTLFVHVPPLHKPFTATEIARGIKNIILRILEGNSGSESVQNEIRIVEQVENTRIKM